MALRSIDLMIGDWVVYRGDAEYTNPVRIEGMDILTCELITEDREDVGFDGIEPIPLTAEILEKNGFVYNAIPFVDGWEQFGLTLYRGGNGYRIDCGINVSLIIDYVHELQHALRLCGIEKEIEL